MTRRVVLDTSTLVSAALRIGSTPHRALLLALGSSEVCGSQETMDELERVLGRRKFDTYLDRESRFEFVGLMRRTVRFFSIENAVLEKIEPLCRDAKDNKFLALALTAEADAIVASDEDLLVLHPWREIDIITPRDFLLRFG